MTRDHFTRELAHWWDQGIPAWGQWLVVLVLTVVALLCLVGPGRLYPKVPFEGPILVLVSRQHGLTLLDLPGLACAGAAVVLGVRLVRRRIREP